MSFMWIVKIVKAKYILFEDIWICSKNTKLDYHTSDVMSGKEKRNDAGGNLILSVIFHGFKNRNL